MLVQTLGRGYALQAVSKNSGLAGDFVGLVQMSGFRLNTATKSGYTLQSDGAGNGRWGPPIKGDKGDNGQNGKDGQTGKDGKDGAPGVFKFTRKEVPVNSANDNVKLSSDANLFGIKGDGNPRTIFLPPAKSVDAGSVLVVSLENPDTPSNNAKITILLQGTDTTPSLSSGSTDFLQYGTGNPVRRYYSDGSSKWIHW